MAMEGSSAADTYAYIGMQISLISKSEIRYEGTLFNLNTHQSTIALNNVRSFGTEGRYKDGPQIPPTDQIYEYILFRGSDIKDLQVKSSPPIQTTTSVYNDPAIIQSHIPQEAATNTSLPFPDTRSQQVTNFLISQLGLPKSSPESSVPISQPDGILPAPVYIKEIQGASADGFQTQQQSLFQPPSGLSALPSMHQTMPYPAMNASTPSRSSKVPVSPLLDISPPLLPSFIPVAPDLHSSFPLQSSALPTDLSTLLKPNKGPAQGLHSAGRITTSLQLVTPPKSILDESAFSTGGTIQLKSADPAMSFNVLESKQLVACAAGSFLNRGLTPPLVTPSHFLQPVTALGSSYQSSQSVHKDVEMVQVASTEQPLKTVPGAQAPILPLPTSLDCKIHGDRLHSGREHWASHDITNFTENFDIVSINEKFNKDEVWGQLGNPNSTQEEGYSQGKDNVDHVDKTTSETMPVYVKDDFIDSPSNNSSGRIHRGGSICSEVKKSNPETFATPAQHRGGHCGRGYGHSGHGQSRRDLDHVDCNLSRDGYAHNRAGRKYGYSGHSRHGRNSRRYGYNDRRDWGHHAT